MNAQVTFESDRFRPIRGEDEKTNPGRYGQALAQWFADQLRARGIQVERPIPEDFGWIVVVSRKPFLLWLSCGNVDDSETEWLVYPVAEPSWVQRLFDRINTRLALAELWRHVQELVPTIPGVRNVVWE
jgi:hypothetical protein